MLTNKAEVLAKDLIAKHLDSRWSFRWNDTERRELGMVNFKRRFVMLSRLLTLDEEPDVVEQVLLRQIAHALTDEKHSTEWKRVAKSIGVRDPNAKRVISKNLDIINPPKYVTVTNGKVVARHYTRPRDRRFASLKPGTRIMTFSQYQNELQTS
jgi:hypothetical protein